MVWPGQRPSHVDGSTHQLRKFSNHDSIDKPNLTLACREKKIALMINANNSSITAADTLLTPNANLLTCSMYRWQSEL